jgi:hypothetical protein
VAKNSHLMLSIKSPVLFAGLFCVFLLCGCEPTTPEGVTEKFWQTLAQGELEASKTQVTQATQHLVTLKDIDNHSIISIGAVTLSDQTNALVTTTINRNKKSVTFNTVLLKEKDSWKVDFDQTYTNIAMVPFDGMVKKLEELGNNFTKGLEESVPLIEKEMENFGNELKSQLDEFGRSLKKPPNSSQNPNNPKPTKPPPNTI